MNPLPAIGHGLAKAGAWAGGQVAAGASTFAQSWGYFLGSVYGPAAKFVGGQVVAGGSAFAQSWAYFLSKVYAPVSGWAGPPVAKALAGLGLGAGKVTLTGIGGLIKGAGAKTLALAGGVGLALLLAVKGLTRAKSRALSVRRRITRRIPRRGAATVVVQESRHERADDRSSLLPLLLVVLAGVLLMPSAFPVQYELLRGTLSGTAQQLGIEPNAFTCARVMPVGGIVGVGDRVGRTVTAAKKIRPVTGAQISRAIVWATYHVELGAKALQRAVSGGPRPTQTVQAPLRRNPNAAYQPDCCASTGGTVATAYTPVSGPAQAGLSADQASNVRIILSVGQTLQAPPQAQVIALMTARQESGLHNLTSGDRDSLGLFQQRPSQGWGSPAQLTDPAFASNAFFTALFAVPGWQTMPLGQAAQAVQRSAYPDAYAQWQPAARSWVQAYAGLVVPVSTTTACTPAVPTSYPASPVSVQQVLSFARAQIGKPYRLGSAPMPTPTGPVPGTYDCSSLVDSAYEAAGIDLPGRQTTATLIGLGTAVPNQASLQPGDVVFLSPSHVGIALGPDRMLVAPHTGDVVKEQNVYSFYGGRRIIGNAASST